MAERITAEKLREIFLVARKLRVAALEEADDDYAGLFERAAEALERRGWQLAVRPFETAAENPPARDGALHRPVNLLC